MIFVAAIFFGRESALEKRLSLGGLFLGKDASVARSTVETIILLGVIAPIGLPQVYGNFGADIANVVVSLRHNGLSRADAAALERGYYEGLTRVNRFNSQPWEIYMNRPNGGWLEVRGSRSEEH